METLSNRQLLYAYGWVLLALVLVTELGLFQKIFDTAPLTRPQWVISLAAAAIFLMPSPFSPHQWSTRAKQLVCHESRSCTPPIPSRILPR